MRPQVLGRPAIDERVVDAERRVAARLERLARGHRPIVVGPWTGEVGFELLYWIPFLRWACATFSIDTRRLFVISRGGAAPWYGQLSARYADVFDHATPDELRAVIQDGKKQYRVRRFDRQVVRRAIRAHGLRAPRWLHPTLLYTLYKASWRHGGGVRRLAGYLRFQNLPPVAASLQLPERFVAVRFYFRESFPDTPGNRRLAAAVVANLAERGDVVLLNTGLNVDDHADFVPERTDRVHRLEGLMQAQTNLAVQTEVISRASALVGTYGGYAYLAPFYGVPAVTFYSDRAFKLDHLELAQRAFLEAGSSPFTPLDVRQAGLIGAALAAVNAR